MTVGRCQNRWERRFIIGAETTGPICLAAMVAGAAAARTAALTRRDCQYLNIPKKRLIRRGTGGGDYV
jgi:hypothetical protein